MFLCYIVVLYTILDFTRLFYNVGYHIILGPDLGGVGMSRKDSHDCSRRREANEQGDYDDDRLTDATVKLCGCWRHQQ